MNFQSHTSTTAFLLSSPLQTRKSTFQKTCFSGETKICQQKHSSRFGITTTAPRMFYGSKNVNTPLRQKTNGVAVRTSQKSSIFKLFRRLRTVQDRQQFHKVSGLVQLSSSVILLAYGAAVHLQQNEWQLPPDWVYSPLLGTWLLTSIANACSGIRMAIKHRSHNRPIRNGFIGASIYVILSAWSAWWMSPNFPESLLPHTVSMTVVGPLAIFGTWNSISTAKDAASIIQSRRDVKAKRDAAFATTITMSWLRDMSLFVAPAVSQLFFYIIISIIVNYDRTLIMKQCEAMDDFQAMVIYFDVALSFSASLLSLVITLRDRRLLSRVQEKTIFSLVLSLSVMAVAEFTANAGSQTLVLLKQATM